MDFGRMVKFNLKRGMSQEAAEKEAHKDTLNMSGNGQGGMYAARSAAGRAKIRARNGR